MPDFSYEDQHEGIICGVDEVGRGPLAGPVVAAAVIIPHNKRKLDFIAMITDSKKLSLKKREYLYDEIATHFPYAIAKITPQEIDDINILQASLKAMKNACEKLPHIDYALIDGNKTPKDLPCPAQTIVKGDSKSVSIAAASIIAKVHRDRIMQDLDKKFPHYGWAKNAGYPTQQHREALLTHGTTPHHRKSFAPVRAVLDSIKLSA
ncbi:MAG: ribonuclease HII [Alphaproteobacteria bacterium]